MSGSTRKTGLIAFFIIVLIGLVNFAWWMFYRNTEQLLDHQLSKRLAAVTRSAKTLLTPKLTLDLSSGDFDAYIRAVDLIEQIRMTDSLSEVFILDDSYNYLVTTELEEDSSYFLRALNGVYIDSVYFGLTDAVIVTPSYRTGSFYLKSAFAPLPDSSGVVAAVLGVEASVDYFDVMSDLKNNLYLSTVISVLGGLLFGAVFLIYQRRVNLAEQRMFMNETHSHLGRMVAVVSHEIKNPLMIIRAASERMVKKHGAEEGRFVIEEVDRLNEIVTGYLDFAKSGGEGGFISRESRQKINLTEFADNLKKHLSSRNPNEEITWLDSKIPSAATVNSYPRALRQVLLNLLMNGAEACREAKKPIVIGVEIICNSGSVTLKSIDHGPGIPAKELKKILTPFYTTRSSGSGLGLYVCNKIVAEMGGTMKIESVPGEKTEVIINLPDLPKE